MLLCRGHAARHSRTSCGRDRRRALPARAPRRAGGGFTALGAAGAVVTTSGTAAANLHPAVLEAHHANRPLVVVTADRPRELRGTWANQTSELQAGLFGAAVRARLDLADTDAARIRRPLRRRCSACSPPPAARGPAPCTSTSASPTRSCRDDEDGDGVRHRLARRRAAPSAGRRGAA